MARSMTRREFIRRSALTSTVLLGVPLVTTCRNAGGDDTLALAQDRGFIRVGFADEVPYGFVSDSGQLTGEAPEVAREVMRRLGVPQLDGVPTGFGSLISDLNDRHFDLIAAGMFITPDRCEQVIFSDPDYCVRQAFLVAEGNPMGISRYEDIAANPDIALGVVTGGVEVTQAEEAGVPPGQVARFDNAAGLLDAVQAGRIDVAALTTISLGSLAQTADFAGVEVTEGFAYREQVGCGAFGFRREDTRFRDEFNRILNQMKDDGELTRFVEPFGFAEAARAAQGLTAEELCAG